MTLHKQMMSSCTMRQLMGKQEEYGLDSHAYAYYRSSSVAFDSISSTSINEASQCQVNNLQEILSECQMIEQ